MKEVPVKMLPISAASRQRAFPGTEGGRVHNGTSVAEENSADLTCTPNRQTSRPYSCALRCAAVLAALGLTLLAPCVARAVTVSWKNPVDGIWSDGTKWSSGTPPGQTDDAVITVAGTYTVTQDVLAAKVASLTLGAASGTQAQTLSLPSNTLTVTGASTVGSLGVLELAGGTLAAGVVTVNGALNWTAGTMSGGATTTIAAGATLTISGGGAKLFSGRTISNVGTATWTSDAADIQASGGSNVFNNTGIFNAQNNSHMSIVGGTLTFNNQAGGTVNRSGAGTTQFAVPFNNASTVNVTSGTLSLADGGSSGGAFTVPLGTTLDLAGGTHNLTVGSILSGAGDVSFSGATANVGGSYTMTGNTNISGGSANFNVATSITGGTLSGGTLGGSATATLTGALSWTGGTISGTGTTAIAPEVTLTTSGVVSVTGTRALNNAGTVNVTSGTLSVAGNPAGGDNSGGAFTVAAGATLDFNAGTHNLTGTSSVSGAGDFSASGNTAIVNIAGSYTLTGNTNISGTGANPSTANFNAPTSITGGTLSGTLGGSATVTVTGTLNWIDGTMGGGGTTAIAPAATLAISGATNKSLSARTVNNLGTVTWTDGSDIRASAGSSVFNNTGTFNALNGDLVNIPNMINSGGTLAFNNLAGATLNQSGVATTGFAVPFTNEGTVNVNSGTLSFKAPSTYTQTAGGAPIFSAGAFPRPLRSRSPFRAVCWTAMAASPATCRTVGK